MALFPQRDKNKAQEYLKEYKNIQHPTSVLVSNKKQEIKTHNEEQQKQQQNQSIATDSEMSQIMALLDTNLEAAVVTILYVPECGRKYEKDPKRTSGNEKYTGWY